MGRIGGDPVLNATVVLHKPQDLVNIAVVIRGMQNFGIKRLRLVQPVEFSPHRVEGIAHKSGDIVRHVTVFDDLDEALADCTHVVGMTARGRTVKRNRQLPREAALEIRSHAEAGRVALLFGPEDKGLTNEDLDRCHRIVTIPTAPDNTSLNLAQAATLIMYEVYQVEADHEWKTPRRTAVPANREVLEGLFGDIERALEHVEFFKSHTNVAIMRTVRELVHRADVDEREAGLMRAMSREVVNFLRRSGIEAP